MKLRFVGSNSPVYGNYIITTNNYTFTQYDTYFPVDFFQPGGQGVALRPFPLDFWILDCQGFHMDAVLLDESAGRRNGIPTHSNLYGYDGTIHLFTIYNYSKDGIHEQSSNVIKNINNLMVYPFTYIIPYEIDEQGIWTATYYDSPNARVLWDYINQIKLDSDDGSQHLESIPVGIRVVFNSITTNHNDGAGANMEFDLGYSIWGVWNKNGQIRLGLEE